MPDPVEQFLQAEERATATLMGFYQQARLDLEAFIRSGDLTPSDQVFYRHLLDETNRIAADVGGKAEPYATDLISEAHSAGWRTHSSIVVSKAALEALSRSTLSLIRQTTDGIRQTIRQSIARAILNGWTGAELRESILASGLTNIPHWPTVEYRAGVIARTETMAAYNAGALGSIEASGARFVRWITSPDEAVCKICLPRDNVVFRIGSLDSFPGDPYPGAQPLPHLPAHPRCRCTIRAEFRGPDGKIIRPGVDGEPPQLPKDAMGGDMPGRLPASAGDLENLAELRWAKTRVAKDEISNQMLGLLNGRAIDYQAALLGPRAPAGGDLAGFENRLKTLESFIRKVKDIIAHEPGLTAADGVNSVHDLLRFTSRFNPDEFTARTVEMVGRLQRDGWKRTKWKPTWEKGGYQGINSNWTRGGVEIEMQFHTPQSFANKERAHEIYRELESLSTASPDYPTLVDEMAEIFNQDKPPGFDRLVGL